MTDTIVKKSNVQKRRDKIQHYIDGLIRTEPLEFKRMFSTDTNIVELTAHNKSNDLDDLVYECFDLASMFASWNPSINNYETSSGRLRSSVDIWRHIRSVRPEVDIFSVMESIYRLRENLYGHYCITVKRAVFRPVRGIDDYRGTAASPSSLICNEYGGIRFSTWKKLHE